MSRDQPAGPAHRLHPHTDDPDRAARRQALAGLHHQLTDETGVPVLYEGGAHIDRRAHAFIKFPGQRWLRFPVRGTSRENAVMTAVDHAGNKVAQYRLVQTGRRRWNTTEITVHPSQPQTDELTLAIAVSAGWLARVFTSSPSSVT